MENTMDITAEGIKKLVDDERVELLTVRLCRHWEVATERLKGLVQELAYGVDTCIDAEVYAAVMRMQSSLKALMELTRMPCTFLFSEYLDRIAKTVSNTELHQAVMLLTERLLEKDAATEAEEDSLFEQVIQMIKNSASLSAEQQDTNNMIKTAAMRSIFKVFAQKMTPEDTLMVAEVMNSEDNAAGSEEIVSRLKEISLSMDELAGKIGEHRQVIVKWLFTLFLLPSLLVSLMQLSRTDSKSMAKYFDDVLNRVRESTSWQNYWKDHRSTLRVVSDSSSLTEVMMAARSRERAQLGNIPGGLFAKWTSDRKAFEDSFLEAHLSDDDLRSFIFHLAALAEIARELDPGTKFGEEQLVNNKRQQVGEAVLAAAQKLKDMTEPAWYPRYDRMWTELIKNDLVFSHLEVLRKSPHNNQFTARFFCHLVGEMKKRAVFGAHSDNDLAKKLTTKYSVGTYRKNIQEGMGDESTDLQNAFDTIFKKCKNLS